MILFQIIFNIVTTYPSILFLMTKRLLLFLAFFISAFALTAQTFAWGIKGGLLVGLQKWESFQQDPLLKYQGSMFIESVPEDNSFALYAQGGLHLKGSAIRNQRFLNNGQIFNQPTTEFIFRNLSVVLGAKQKSDFGATASKYYSFGVRADYTLNTNLEDLQNGQLVSIAYPVDAFVRKFNYGVSVGGGLEFPFSELVGAIVDLTINPDVSFQYRQPPLGNVPSPFDPGQTISVSERRIVNVSVELSVGFRFLRKVEYID